MRIFKSNNIINRLPRNFQAVYSVLRFGDFKCLYNCRRNLFIECILKLWEYSYFDINKQYLCLLKTECRLFLFLLYYQENKFYSPKQSNIWPSFVTTLFILMIIRVSSILYLINILGGERCINMMFEIFMKILQAEYLIDSKYRGQ